MFLGGYKIFHYKTAIFLSNKRLVTSGIFYVEIKGHVTEKPLWLLDKSVFCEIHFSPEYTPSFPIKIPIHYHFPGPVFIKLAETKFSLKSQVLVSNLRLFFGLRLVAIHKIVETKFSLRFGLRLKTST